MHHDDLLMLEKWSALWSSSPRKEEGRVAVPTTVWWESKSSHARGPQRSRTDSDVHRL